MILVWKRTCDDFSTYAINCKFSQRCSGLSSGCIWSHLFPTVSPWYTILYPIPIPPRVSWYTRASLYIDTDTIAGKRPRIWKMRRILFATKSTAAGSSANAAWGARSRRCQGYMIIPTLYLFHLLFLMLLHHVIFFSASLFFRVSGKSQMNKFSQLALYKSM